MSNSTRHGRRFRYAMAVILAGVALSASCSAYRGYGVLVWKNENLPFPIGEQLNISSIFSVDNYYEVDYRGTLVQVPMWQVQFFNSLDEARRFQAEFSPLKNLYVVTLKPEGLPIREEAKTTARINFKLKSGRLAKVIGRDKQRTKIEHLEDYWYSILTEEGYRGYIFGHFLKTIESASDIESKIAELIKADPLLERFLTNVWRPTKIADMIDSGRIDVNYLNKNYGLIPKPNENKIILRNEDVENKEYVYTAIKKISGDTYEFTGTDLKVQIFPVAEVTATYLLNGVYTTTKFVLIDKNLEELGKSETSRSQNILKKFTKQGSALESNSYGTIQLSADYRFDWRDFGSLRSVLPPATAGQGVVNFSRYPGKLIASDYDGAITFVFDDSPGFDVTFVYRFQESGVRFVYAAKEYIFENEIRRLGPSPLVLYFNFVK